MATVTGFTSQRMKQIEDTTIVSGTVDSAGNFQLVQRNGVKKSAGSIKGPKGDKGDTGSQGLKGDKGDKGDTGAQGLKGDKGDTGAQGLKGDKGDTGAQGLKGDKGDIGPSGTNTGPWYKLTLKAPWVPYVGGGDYREGLWVRKVGDSNIQLSGIIKSGGVGQIATINVAGMLPSLATQFVAMAYAGTRSPAYIYIKAGSGIIEYLDGPNAPGFMVIDHITPLN